MRLSLRNAFARRGMLVGLCAAGLAGVVVVSLRSPANAATALRPQIGPLSPKAVATLERVSENFQKYAFDAALTDLRENLRGLTVSGEMSDYFGLKLAELKMLAAQGRFEEMTNGFIEWMAATPTELVAQQFVQFAVIGLARYDDLNLALAQLDPQATHGAAARLNVARLEVGARVGDYSVFTNEAIARIANLAVNHPISRDVLFGVHGLLPSAPDAPRQTEVAGAIASAVGAERLTANFALNWAATAHSEGALDDAARALGLAEPLLATITEEVRWHWLRANVAYDRGALTQAREHSDIVKQLAEGAELDVDFHFVHQAQILDSLVARAFENRFGVPLDAGDRAATAEPCDDVVPDIGHDDDDDDISHDADDDPGYDIDTP